jgi:hypothetical protein
MTHESIAETDERFPTGPWTGFFLQQSHPGRNRMKLELTFAEGKVVGTGSDWVGRFIIEGTYQTTDGRCQMTKSYLGRHSLHYQGYNEGKGIWGVWELVGTDRGGFYIWPEGMPDPTTPRMKEEADLPIAVSEVVVQEEQVVRTTRS